MGGDFGGLAIAPEHPGQAEHCPLQLPLDAQTKRERKQFKRKFKSFDMDFISSKLLMEIISFLELNFMGKETFATSRRGINLCENDFLKIL